VKLGIVNETSPGKYPFQAAKGWKRDCLVKGQLPTGRKARKRNKGADASRWRLKSTSNKTSATRQFVKHDSRPLERGIGGRIPRFNGKEEVGTSEQIGMCEIHIVMSSTCPKIDLKRPLS